jgi:hypothetical protein
MNRTVIDMRERFESKDAQSYYDLWLLPHEIATRKARANAHGYYTTCPASVAAMPSIERSGVVLPIAVAWPHRVARIRG